MYAILVSIALAIYTIILVDFGLLFQEISVNADILTSAQALYTAEGAVESTFSLIGKGDVITRNIRFANEVPNDEGAGGEAYLPYNEGVDSFYINRKVLTASSDLKASDAYVETNRIVRSEAYLADGQTLDQKAYYGLEPRTSKGFSFREIRSPDNFNEVTLEYNLTGESSEMLFEVFAFPREGGALDFLDFERLKNDFGSSVQRIVVNTKDLSQNGGGVGPPDALMNVHFGNHGGNYTKFITIAGFQPLTKNYLLRFQTLDNKPVHYKLSAVSQGVPVTLPGMLQTIDVIGATPSGLYQRVKYQRQTEEALQPGLNFIHFSDKIIHK